MEVRQELLAILAVLIAVNFVLAGLVFLRVRQVTEDFYAPRAGFGSSDLRAPLIPSDDPGDWEPKPSNITQDGAGFTISSRWQMGPVHAVWGGELRYWVKNAGREELFIYGFSLQWSGGPSTSKPAGVTVAPEAEADLGMLHFQGPDAPGTREFTVKTAILSRKGGPSPEERWHDHGLVGNRTRTVDVLPLGSLPEYGFKKNPGHYFDKVNGLVDPGDPAVAGKAASVASSRDGPFDLFDAAEAFDFVYQGIVYVNDPEGRDHWAPPEETMRKMAGDCEDHALLLSALVTALNGTARFHMEKEHAFCSVYVGKDLAGAESALERWYGTPLDLAWFEDASGYWLAADSTSSMYLGGLPLGGQPLSSGAGRAWDLTNTTFLYSIDVLPR